MHSVSLLVALLACGAAGLQSPHRLAPAKQQRVSTVHRGPAEPKQYEYLHLNAKSDKFAVNGTGVPLVDFDIGESYAGTLSIDENPDNQNKLFFWFFPSQNPAAKDEITIWLNGGPGCSSMDGLLQENGPFLWQSGTYAPVSNPYSWTNLTNMIYIDQPVGTGFSTAAPGAPANIKSEKDVADNFMGFWKNFFDTFDLHGRKVYITGESYAGQYIPYIAHYMLEKNDTQYFNVKGIQINDPSVNDDSVLINAPAVPALHKFQEVIKVNETFLNDITDKAEKCGYLDFMNKALTFPPAGKMEPPRKDSGCDVFSDIIEAATLINPCFNIYHLTDFCPFLWDNLGFPSLAPGPVGFFNRTDVQQAIHAPPTDYSVCGDDSLGLRSPGDQSVPSGLGPLPGVIERTNNVIIGHGMLDFLLFANGTLATIQNMTWNGQQGFQSEPKDNFFVPYTPELASLIDATQHGGGYKVSSVGGAGYMGTTHSERGLTWCTVDLAGHMIPQYTPGAAFRQLELLLGRIPNLTTQGAFTTQGGQYNVNSDGGKGNGNHTIRARGEKKFLPS
ncbi:carboxypeptidase 4 [Piedraia hortae CBS 480.64]|uniref:Carboxypeptidase n=1 Tax=Piedraia hortae CBS 480.64 TaxID=1314780 RepID=A0A6A7C8N2_9PEZI|nr:carboxypeptidase 4 [Piedraia hortae CBS 480.64]